MAYKHYIEQLETTLEQYWEHVSSQLLQWKLSYQWPPNVQLEEAILLRNKLEAKINNDLNFHGYLSRSTFDAVMTWGFGHSVNISDSVIHNTTRTAFEFLSKKNLYQAALALTSLPGIGISRASKILALAS